MNIINLEQPKGVVVQFGGQTAINLADKPRHGVQILGTSLEDLNRAEDRKEFEALLRQIYVPQPQGKHQHHLKKHLKMRVRSVIRLLFVHHTY